MTLSDAVKARLLDITPVVALVGQRVFELVLPQNEKRASIRYQVFGKPFTQHFRGRVNQFSQRCRVDAYVGIDQGNGDPIGLARDIGEAVIGDGLGTNASGFAGWVGVVETSSASPDDSIHVLGVDVLDDGEPMFEEDELKRIRLRQEFMVHWRVSSATVSA